MHEQCVCTGMSQMMRITAGSWRVANAVQGLYHDEVCAFSALHLVSQLDLGGQRLNSAHSVSDLSLQRGSAGNEVSETASNGY